MYVVARLYSHTDRHLLWKVVSRPIQHKPEADLWCDHMKAVEPKHEFFVVHLEN